MTSAANGVPFHFDTVDLSGRNGGAQTLSAGAHVAILLVLVFAVASTPDTSSFRHATPLDPIRKLLAYVPRLQPQATGRPSLGSDGSGGGRDTRPPRFGNLAPGSSIPLVPPRLTHNDHPVLPTPPAVFDADAPANVPVVTNLGFPWMNSNTNSAGRGNGHGFGDSNGDTMGNGSGSGAGEGDEHGPYANVASPVSCIYCPEPGYTEEARKAKLQGKLLLEVLVGPDGRPTQIRILQGLGLGLDEKAIETLRTWRFSPGRDAAKRPVPGWVTVETRFQLY
ncbi:MAG TPA: energy transducer TonB [Candidatus Acidoferrum sp.]|nr:energy transducer TonB [Candidatus Acidoferrum sp.]